MSEDRKPTVVLVHGAFADGSGWLPVIELLQDDGYTVVAVQNSMESLAGDVATTKRAIDAITGPVVVVGHSYGGAVIGGAAADNPNVVGLVFIAAFALEPGEPVAALLPDYPVDLDTATVPDAAGFVFVDPAKFHAVFAADLPVRQARAMAAAQKPIRGTVFGESTPRAAWKSVPSWYIVNQHDHALNPDLERLYAKRINAITREIPSSHVSFLSHPRAVADVVEEAAVGAGAGTPA